MKLSLGLELLVMASAKQYAFVLGFRRHEAWYIGL